MVLQNETSLKMAKEVSWKYHQFLEMHHKTLIRSRKNAIKKQENALISY